MSAFGVEVCLSTRRSLLLAGLASSAGDAGQLLWRSRAGGRRFVGTGRISDGGPAMVDASCAWGSDRRFHASRLLALDAG
jgi:hypothetical protein